MSQAYDSDQRVSVCDNEADGRGVHADYESNWGTTGRVDDTNGSASPCYGSEAYSSGINRHRTVEEIPDWPDAVGEWRYE